MWGALQFKYIGLDAVVQLLSNRAAVISYGLLIGWQVPPAIHQFMVMGCVCTWPTKTPQSPSHKAVLSTSGITRSGRSAKSGRPSTFGVELRPDHKHDKILSDCQTRETLAKTKYIWPCTAENLPNNLFYILLPRWLRNPYWFLHALSANRK